MSGDGKPLAIDCTKHDATAEPFARCPWCLLDAERAAHREKAHVLEYADGSLREIMALPEIVARYEDGSLDINASFAANIDECFRLLRDKLARLTAVVEAARAVVDANTISVENAQILYGPDAGDAYERIGVLGDHQRKINSAVNLLATALRAIEEGRDESK